VFLCAGLLQVTEPVSISLAFTVTQKENWSEGPISGRFGDKNRRFSENCFAFYSPHGFHQVTDFIRYKRSLNANG
jgi:hypothetical protein